MVVGTVEQEAGLDPGQVERVEPLGRDVVGAALLQERVVDGQGVVVADPDLVPEVTGVSRAGDHRVGPRDLALRGPEEPHGVHVGVCDLAQDLAAERALEGQRGQLARGVLDPDVKPAGVPAKPMELRIGRGQAEAILGQARDRPVVEQLAAGVGPARVRDATRLERGDVPARHEREELASVGAGDVVFVQRRHVHEPCGLADREVLTLVTGVERADSEIPGPVLVAHAAAQGRGPRVKWRGSRHGGSL